MSGAREAYLRDTPSDLAYRAKWWSSRAVIYGVLILWAIVCIFPIFWTISTSFKTAPDVMQGHLIPWLDFEPAWLGWRSLGLSPDTIGGSSTVRDEFLGRFVAYPSEPAHVAHTLWIAHTHLMDAWESTPRIAFLSPEPGSGKTRALEITELLVPRPVEAVNVTPAYLFRKVGSDDGRPTILFDEIDTGIGGRSADPVGRSLWALARSHQVVCVTHLPQIAAHADAHFAIAKRERDGRTVTEVRRLDREGRIVELAQMIGGTGGGTAALASARELLDRAEAWRGELLASG